MMSNSLKCLTPFKPTESKTLTTMYDLATELVFELEQAIDETAFLSIHLNDEALYLYQDDLVIQGSSFKVLTDQNFLDAMKDFAYSGQAHIKLSVQLELQAGTLSFQESLINPWF